MKIYALRHLQVLLATVGQMVRTPLGTALTVAVMGIALALPTGLYLLISNVERVSAGWDRGTQISVFMKPASGDAPAAALSTRLRQRTDIQSVTLISQEQSLAAFKRDSGFGDALDALDTNPLPAVLLVRPAPAARDASHLAQLVRTLKQEPGVDLVQLDMEWVKRLQALLALAQRGVWMLAALLGLAAVLVIGNTTRLAVLNRRTEIEVIKLIGGTGAFIRRPFLYAGFLQGLLGATCAWLTVELAVALLGGPIRELSGLYGSDFRLVGLGWGGGGRLLLVGAILGWVGARLTVGRHLREIEPK